jgi:hypothetical protein
MGRDKSAPPPTFQGGAEYAIRAAQTGLEFLAAAADGIDVQASDARDQSVATVAEFVGLQGGQPASLLLVQAAHQQIELVVDLAGGMLPAGAVGTLAAMNNDVHHGRPSEHSLGRLLLYKDSGTNCRMPP